MTKAVTKYPELKGYKTLEIPVSVIYLDNDFNCRDAITPMSCLELSESMRTRGLKIPIMVQPSEDVDGLPDGYEYRIVAGHRRFTAAKYLLRWGKIPATVIEGLSREEAQLLNLIENLDRKDLSLYDQAVALRRSFPKGTPYQKMATALSRSSGWVRLRWRIMDSPEEVQKLIKEGTLTPNDLLTLSYKGKEEQKAIAAELELAKLNGDSIRCFKKDRLAQRRSRPIYAIDEMLTMLTAKGRYPDPYEVLAWAAGRVSDDELLKSDLGED